MLKVKDIAQARQFVYVNPEDGRRIEDMHYHRAETKAKEYRSANNYPIGGNWSEQFEANVCANSNGVCEEFVPPTTRQRMSSVATALARSARSGFRMRSAEEIETILHDFCRDGAKLGGRCNYYLGASGALGIACQKCGCSKLKLNMKTEHCPLKYW